MTVFSQAEFNNHEQVVFCHDQASGLKAIIAVHDTTLGPAVGGCRLWNYQSDEEALVDVLRLSKGMTYKNALAGLPLGGGKSVIIGDAKTIKSEELFRAFGRCLNDLGGKYYSAEDVNITTTDIMIAHEETNYVSGLEGKSGNPGPFTAYGTYLGVKAAVKHQLGKDSLQGIKVAVQGLGSVGYGLCEYLHKDGAELFVTDINSESMDRAATELGATVVGLDDIYHQDVDVYSPCALGATVNDNTLQVLKASIIAGCANNQLAESRHGDAVKAKGILYAPDYVINAGGIINVAMEHYPEEYSAERAKEKVTKIYDTLLDIFQRADKSGIATHIVADQMAQEIIANAKK